MPRALSALQEWLELRARVREERRFHLDQATADFLSRGLSRRAARRTARSRFGARRSGRIALREIGGDGAGLAHLFRAHRVPASVWFQPVVLLTAIVLLFIFSPAPRELVEGLIGRTLKAEDRGAVAIRPGPWSGGITPEEFAALRSMTTVTEVEWNRTRYVRARAVHGVTLAAITSEACARTGNRAFYAAWLSGETKIETRPAKVIWLFIAFYGVFFMLANRLQFGRWRWLLHAAFVGCLHVLASLSAWALATQLWSRTLWPTPLAAGYLLAVTFMVVAGVQCRYWWHDLQQRCPICLERMLLSWTQGEPDRVLLSVAVTESVCAHGHGVLVESRWARQFRHERSPLQGLIPA